MQNDPRSRILLLLQLLLKQTDEHHYATGADILRFWETHGIQTTRKNVYSDIQLLMDFGLDIICIKSTQNRYFIGSRLLELPELKLLVDAVESSHLITEKKSAALIEKLGHLTSRHNAAILNRPIYMDGTAKPDNEAVYYAIDAIQTAIHEQRAISFQYFEYTPKKEKVLKHKGYRYGFSPYTLIWNRDFYYAVGWSEKHGKLAQFRVDRMTAIQETDAPYTADPSFDPASYLREVFGMYHDAPRRVMLLCENRTMRNVIDHFGEDVATEVVDTKHFRATVDVAPTILLMGIHLRRRHPYRRACGGSGENEEYGRVAAYIKARGIRPGNAGQIPLTFIEQEGRCGDTFPAAALPDFSPKSIPVCQ